jgi:hypothetical protein
VPLVFPINALAIGEVTEIFPAPASTSGSPTICQIRFSRVSSSISVTVAPNLIVSPESLDTSMISARASLFSKSAIRFSFTSCSDCDSRLIDRYAQEEMFDSRPTETPYI